MCQTAVWMNLSPSRSVMSLLCWRQLMKPFCWVVWLIESVLYECSCLKCVLVLVDRRSSCCWCVWLISLFCCWSASQRNLALAWRSRSQKQRKSPTNTTHHRRQEKGGWNCTIIWIDCCSDVVRCCHAVGHFVISLKVQPTRRSLARSEIESNRIESESIDLNNRHEWKEDWNNTNSLQYHQLIAIWSEGWELQVERSTNPQRVSVNLASNSIDRLQTPSELTEMSLEINQGGGAELRSAESELNRTRQVDETNERRHY